MIVAVSLHTHVTDSSFSYYGLDPNNRRSPTQYPVQLRSVAIDATINLLLVAFFSVRISKRHKAWSWPCSTASYDCSRGGDCKPTNGLKACQNKNKKRKMRKTQNNICAKNSLT